MKSITAPHSIALSANKRHKDQEATIATNNAVPFRSLPKQSLIVEIVVPVLNEAHVLAASITRLHAYMSQHLPYKFRITVADNGSSDGTLRIAEELTRTLPNVHLLHLTQKGRGRALKKAWLSSKANILTYMDVDLSTDLGAFLTMIEPLIVGDAAVGIGSRLQKSSNTKRSWKREFISRTYNWIIRRSIPVGFSDAQCGFKAIRADAACELLPQVVDGAWFFDTELLIKTEQRGWTIHEVAVSWDEDTDSRVNLINTASDDLKGLSRLRKEAGRSPLWEKPALVVLLLIALLAYTIDITHNGYANSFYAASVQAASTSWKAWFYGSLDGSSFITVDKPPLAIWVMGLSARIFGFSSASMLIPDALAGVGTVWLVYASVKRLFGSMSALIAGIVMLITPVAALMFRFNNPDSFLTLYLAASGYAFLRALDSPKALRWLSLAGLFTGFAFNTKMIQGWILLPVMGLVYLIFGQPKFWKRTGQLLIAGIVAAVSSLWWATIDWLVPAASRPYVSSSTNNSIWNLIFGYNGIGRLTGSASGHGGGRGGMRTGALPTGTATHAFTMPTGGFGGRAGGGMGPGGTGFGGHTGFFRIFNSDFGPNIAWYIPLALIAAGLMIWLLRRAPRSDARRITVVFWAGWLLIHTAVFSITSGTIHPYYPVVMAPAIAALVGIGLPYIWKAYKNRTTLAWVLPLSIAATAITSFYLLQHADNWPWLKWAVLITGFIASLAFFDYEHRLLPVIRKSAVILALFSALAAPLTFTATTIASAHTGSIPTSGPSTTAVSVKSNESASADKALVSYLLKNRDGAKWIVAVSSANESAPIQISAGQPVMAVGGFSGSDNAITLANFKKLVSSGQLRYYAVSSTGRGGFGGGGFGGGMGGTSDSSAIATWAETYGTKVNYGGTGTSLYILPS